MEGKDYGRWHRLKAALNRGSPEEQRFIKERQIWYCALGANIGSEQDGKGRDFSRPVLVIRVFNRDVFVALPLTSAIKSSSFYSPLEVHGRKGSVILSQIRLLDRRRLIRYLGMARQQEFALATLKLERLLFRGANRDPLEKLLAARTARINKRNPFTM